MNPVPIANYFDPNRHPARYFNAGGVRRQNTGNNYAEAFKAGQQIMDGLAQAMAQRKRDAIANQLLQELGYNGTGGETELALRQRVEQMRDLQRQRELQAQLREAQAAKLQRDADAAAQRDHVANDLMGQTAGMEKNSGGGAAEMELRLKMQAAQDRAAQLRHQQQMQDQAARMKGLALTPDEKDEAAERKKQIDALNKETRGLRDQLVSSGLPVDEMLGADEVNGISSKGDPKRQIPAGGNADDGDTLAIRTGSKQTNLQPTFDMMNAKGLQGMSQALGAFRSLKDKQGQLQGLMSDQKAVYGRKIGEMAGAGDPDAKDAAAAIARGADPEAVYRRLLQHKATAAPGGQGAPADSSGAASSFGVPLGYEPAAAADGLDPQGLADSSDSGGIDGGVSDASDDTGAGGDDMAETLAA